MKYIFIFFTMLLFGSQNGKAQAGFTVSTQLCSNVTTTLIASTGAMSNCTYTWSGSPVGVSFSAINGSVTGVSFSSAGSYSILLTIASGTMVSTLQAGVNVVAPPAMMLVQSSYTSCITGNYPLTAKSVTLYATGSTNYTWNPPPDPIQWPINGPNNTVTLTTTSCFSVTGENVIGCTTTTAVCVTVVPQFTITVTPASTFICLGQIGSPDVFVDLTMNNSSQPPFGQTDTYTWSGFGFVTSRFMKNVKAAPLSTTSYTAEMRDFQGCVSTPAIATVSVIVCTDLQAATTDNELFSVYPNPTSDKLFISAMENFPGLLITLFNTFGEQIMTVKPIETSIELGNLSSGVYFLQVETQNKRQITKVVKQ